MTRIQEMPLSNGEFILIIDQVGDEDDYPEAFMKRLMKRTGAITAIWYPGTLDVGGD